jgi:hypothetical protein
MSGPPIIGGSQDAAEPEAYESDKPVKGCFILLQRGLKFHKVCAGIFLTVVIKMR